MSTLGVGFFTACGENDDEITPAMPGAGGNGITVNGATVTIDLTQQTTLASAGGWLLIVEAQLLVVNDNGYAALTSVCTHSNCDRSWTYSNRVFECTCHGSRFDTNGAVVRGPAASNLQTYSTSLDGNILTIEK